MTMIEACFNPSYHGIVYHEFVFVLVSQGKLKSSIGGDIFVIHSRTFFSSGIVSLQLFAYNVIIPTSTRAFYEKYLCDQFPVLKHFVYSMVQNSPHEFISDKHVKKRNANFFHGSGHVSAFLSLAIVWITSKRLFCIFNI